MTKTITHAVAATLFAVSTVAAAQTPTATPTPAAVEAPTVPTPANATDVAEQTVKVEVFEGPKTKRMQAPPYPMVERKEGRDGWVILNFMVDPHGKPYEIEVMESSGNKNLEKAAVRTAKDWEFEPATLDGTPIDAGHVAQVDFVLTDQSGAKGPFISAYREFLDAIKSQDRTKADKGMARLKVQNLYEDAFYNLAQYEYARLWGTEDQQRIALRRATAGENYLSKSAFRGVLEALMPLEIRRNDFAGALATWSRLEKVANEETKARWKEPISRIKALRTDPSPYSVAGDFADSTLWTFLLFRNRFHIAVNSGQIAEIKLRCDKKYVFFRYDPELVYAIEQKYGACSMGLVGDPGTKFTLTQL